MKFSPSMIKKWMKCQQQAAFSYVDKIPDDRVSAAAEYGSMVHLALEAFNNNEDPDEAMAVFRDGWDNADHQEMEYPPRTSFGQYRDKGIKMVEAYIESRQWASDDIIATEHRFCVPIGKHELSGIVDALTVDEAVRQLKIVDYKTGYRPNADNLHLDIQFTGYFYAVHRKEFWTGVEGSDRYVGFPNGEELFEKYRDYNKSAIWFDTRNTKEYDVGPRGTADIVRLYRCLDSIEAAIEAGVFVPNISGDTCKWCSYQEICPVYLTEDQVGKHLEI